MLLNWWTVSVGRSTVVIVPTLWSNVPGFKEVGYTCRVCPNHHHWSNCACYQPLPPPLDGRLSSSQHVNCDQRKAAVATSQQLPAIAGAQTSIACDYRAFSLQRAILCCILCYISCMNAADGLSLIQSVPRPNQSDVGPEWWSSASTWTATFSSMHSVTPPYLQEFCVPV